MATAAPLSWWIGLPQHEWTGRCVQHFEAEANRAVHVGKGPKNNPITMRKLSTFRSASAMKATASARRGFGITERHT